MKELPFSSRKHFTRVPGCSPFFLSFLYLQGGRGNHAQLQSHKRLWRSWGKSLGGADLEDLGDHVPQPPQVTKDVKTRVPEVNVHRGGFDGTRIPPLSFAAARPITHFPRTSPLPGSKDLATFHSIFAFRCRVPSGCCCSCCCCCWPVDKGFVWILQRFVNRRGGQEGVVNEREWRRCTCLVSRDLWRSPACGRFSWFSWFSGWL